MYLMNKYFNINLLKVNSIGVILFPIALISGPFIPDLLCSYFAIYFLCYIFIFKKFDLLNNKFFYFFLFIYIYLNLNSLISFDPSISFKTSLPYIRVVLFIFFLSFIIERNFKVLKYLYIVFFLIILSLSIDSFIQFFFQKNIFGQDQFHSRISSFFGDELIMGSYVSRLLPCMIGLSYLIKINNLNKLNFLLIFLSFVLVIFSAERVAFFYISLFIFFYLIINKDLIIKFASLSILFLILNYFYNPIFVDRILNHTVFQMKQSESVLSYRHQLHINTAYEMYLDKKFFGHGLKSFRHKCSEEKYTSKILEKTIKDKQKFISEYNQQKSAMSLDTKLQPLTTYKDGCNTHPHNIYFELLAELGFIGFLLYLILFIYFVLGLFSNFSKIFFQNKTEKYYYCELFILIGIVSTMFPMIPSGSLFNNWMMLISFFPIGILYFVKKNFSQSIL